MKTQKIWTEGQPPTRYGSTSEYKYSIKRAQKERMFVIVLIKCKNADNLRLSVSSPLVWGTTNTSYCGAD